MSPAEIPSLLSTSLPAKNSGARISDSKPTFRRPLSRTESFMWAERRSTRSVPRTAPCPHLEKCFGGRECQHAGDCRGQSVCKFAGPELWTVGLRRKQWCVLVDEGKTR